jgi:PhzF family phenazine biosynthesis protein
MRIPIYQIDAFTGKLFSGNPAAVCPLESWLDDETMQAIGAENNLSETAFFVPKEDRYELRWFTPKVEVNLCGHATLATSFVLFSELGYNESEVRFETRSGTLVVRKEFDLLYLDFPARIPKAVDSPPELVAALGKEPVEVLKSVDYLCVYESEDDVLDVSPDFSVLNRLDSGRAIITAPGMRSDFVSRFFAPGAGINEDPVTGAAHCTLVPYWSRRLSKPVLHALQVSARGGEIFCEDKGERVSLAGRAVRYMKGEIEV